MNDDDSQFEFPDDLEATRLAEQTVRVPERIDHYRILQRLGEGGMGVIYEAEQEQPVRRKVALKVIKAGMDTEQVIVRFESERQALALMNHPNIARVYDAGATEEGRPYFAMEYVKGVPITDYCDKNRLDTHDRLELFIHVCEGMQHAHQKGIIHRDIKPSNVLVTDEDNRRVPKIIDFGIAKATAQRLTEKTFFTEMGQLVGTPEYMSPEQAEMSGLDIDTRTDVYLLGVLLYELLTGELPFGTKLLREVGFNEFRRKVLEDDPPRPSTRVTGVGDAATLVRARRTELPALSKQLRGDLDWITMKALDKDRTRRYASASELANEVRRFLDNEPVLASPPSNLYRLRKFVRRHRAGTTFGAVLLVLLAGFAVTMTVQAQRIASAYAETTKERDRANAERDRAEQEAATAREVAGFLEGLFEVSDPRGEELGNTITARQILDEGAARIRLELHEQPQLQARMMRTIGVVYGNLGLSRESLALLEEALRIQRDVLDDEDLELALTMEHLAGVLAFPFGEFGRARQYLQRALEIRRDRLGDADPLVAATLNKFANTLTVMGQYEWALRTYEEASAILEASPEPDEVELAKVLHNRANLLMQTQGNYRAARPLEERALRILRRSPEANNHLVAAFEAKLGDVLEAEGDLGAARRHHERALEIRREIFGHEHTKVAQSLLALAMLRAREGDGTGAAQLHDEALGIIAGTGDHDNPLVVHELARYAAVTGNRDEAIRQLRRSVVEMEYSGAESLLEDRNLESLRGDPAFDEIVAAARRRVGS